MGVRQFAKFSFGYVDDGTRCDDYDENSGLCLNGKCQVRVNNTINVLQNLLVLLKFKCSWVVCEKKELDHSELESWKISAIFTVPLFDCEMLTAQWVLID